MNASRRKTKVTIIVVAVVFVISALAIYLLRQSNDCHDIIGDGYPMGTDPEPVVIGNTCDQ